MKHKITISLSILIFNSLISFSQEINDSVKWISIEKASELFIKTQKPILLYFYNNCDTCRKMESETFSNTEVSNYINAFFYPVKIDANEQKPLTFFDGTVYKNSVQDSIKHDLLKMLVGENDSLPVLVLFNRRAEGSAFFGFKNRDEIFRVLIYYAEDMGLSVTFSEWYKYHTKGYPAGQKQIVTRLIIKWKTLAEAEALKKIEPRKTLLNFYSYYRTSCTLMRTQTYNHPVIAKYLNKKYYPVNVDVYTTDTLQIFGQTYINENKPHKFHQLPINALEGKMSFPSFLILDEEGKVLIKIFQYMTPEKLEPIIRYYGDDIYKQNISYQEFIKTFKSEIN